MQVMCGQPPVPIKSERLTYNGHTQQEFNVRRTARYVDQNDLHNANLTVRETLRFSALCQGPGYNQSALFWRLLVSLRTLGGQLLLATFALQPFQCSMADWCRLVYCQYMIIEISCGDCRHQY